MPTPIEPRRYAHGHDLRLRGAVDHRQARPSVHAARRVLLIVSTASACGFHTASSPGLEQLWQTYRDRGLVIVRLRRNEFGGQDPGENGEIASFCQINYGVSFPMMGKVKVNGAESTPL